VILDGLSYRRAGRVVGISKTEVGDSLDRLLGPLAALGFCQPDGTFITTLDELGERLAEMACSGEAVCVDGLATLVYAPGRPGPPEGAGRRQAAHPYRPGCRCPRSGMTCRGWTAAGQVAATSTSC
jgi:hypothetical protein